MNAESTVIMTDNDKKHSDRKPPKGSSSCAAVGERALGSLKEHPVTLRLPEKLLEGIEELLPLVAQDLEIAAMGRVSRSQVLRIAVLQGLNVLRERYGLDRVSGKID